MPDWKLHITNRVQYFLVDLEEDRLIDVVNLDDMVTSMDITMQLSGQQAGSAGLFAGEEVPPGQNGSGGGADDASAGGAGALCPTARSGSRPRPAPPLRTPPLPPSAAPRGGGGIVCCG